MDDKKIDQTVKMGMVEALEGNRPHGRSAKRYSNGCPYTFVYGLT